MNQASTQSILMKVTGLSKYYGGLTAVNNVNLNIHYGEILALVGDNGAGKSTLVKALAGALKPDSGQIEFEEKRLDWKILVMLKKQVLDVCIRV